MLSERGEAALAAPLMPVPDVPAHPETPTLVRLGELVAAALAWAGMTDWAFRIVDGRNPLDTVDDWRTTDPHVELVAIEGRRLILQVAQLGCDDVLLAAVCHEVARAAVAAGTTTADPYRERADSLQHWSEQDEIRAGVASVVLGFGLVIAAAGRRTHRTTEIVGRTAVTRTAQFRVGSLSGADLSRLLALRLAARGAEPAEVDAVTSQLDPTPAELVRSTLAELPPDRVLDHRGPAPTLRPLDEAMREELRAADEAFRQPMRGQTGRRYFEHKTLPYLIVASLVAMIPAIALGVSVEWWLGLASLGGGAALGAVLGRRRLLEYCGACWMVVRPRETACPKCGITLGERSPLSSKGDHLDEDVDDELTRAALAATADDDPV